MDSILINESSYESCGCHTTTIHSEPPQVKWEPCIAHALQNAGIMLQQAAERMHEAEEHRLQELEMEREALRTQAEDWIGGTD